ncbi:helix-turn-helix transcriptional regulator [Iodidimonas sp. SYSU 1G8]|uniref:helix-turn-helix domain-containing protein n=1 Tax=Iodidimonas sp. SYSU 1G8 TaxID=3133967 RepID=UPI0031FF1E2D
MDIGGYTLIRALAGDERIVIVSEELFDRLMKVAEETSLGSLAEWVNSSMNRDALPIALAQRLMQGETPHKLYRELRGFSTTRLAEAAGLPHDYIVGVETGQTEETLEARRKIASVLHVKLDDLEPIAIFH